ncbi:MAG: hypothetical protein QFX34_04985, partial [Candidatus Verstraetearchaeota archaeon]|nr:hypothetical protein [Candidatus Verstraetearchaeota archaeon]
MLPAIFAAFPLVAATITERPVVYYQDATADPLSVAAGANVSIYLGNMTITGGQVWLWLSRTGSADANIAAGDRWYAGPFYVGDIFDGPKEYTFVPGASNYYVPAPFAMEGRNYTYTVGGGWINGTIPYMVQGGVNYWLKVTDVDPVTTPSVPSSDVGVSTNRIAFTGGFFMTPTEGAPNTPVTVSGYAVPATATYNITQNDIFVANVSVQTHDESGWIWTGFSYTFPIVDLKNKLLCEEEYMEEPYETVTVNVINTSGATVATFEFDEYYRQVWIDYDAWHCITSDFSYMITYHGCEYGCDYVCGIVFYTGEDYNVTLKWFPYMGSASIYLNSTLVASNIALDEDGSVGNYTITIPYMPSGTYYFKVIDNNNVQYNFTVCVVQVPTITFDPNKGGCGDQVKLKFVNMADYVGEYVTVWFDFTPACLSSLNEDGNGNEDGIDDDLVMLANFTVPSSSFEITVTVPHSAGGYRYVFLGDINGTPLVIEQTNEWIDTKFLVTPKVWVDPASFNNDGLTFWVYGCGFLVNECGDCCYDRDEYYGGDCCCISDLVDPEMDPYVKYYVAVDNQYIALAGGYGRVTANYTGDIAIQFVKAGFRPGTHVVSFYNDYGTVAGNFPLYAYGTFTVGTTGDLVIDMINAKLVSIEDDIATVQTELGT